MNTFIPTDGAGALFGKEIFETGEISISGNWTTPEGVYIELSATLLEDGSLKLSGKVPGHPELSCTGILKPTTPVGSYKAGYICIKGGDRVEEYKLDSRHTLDHRCLPYRFIWETSNRVAI
jgi:hypothetical protein